MRVQWKFCNALAKGKPKHAFGYHVLLLCSSAEVSAAFRLELRELLRLPLNFGLHSKVVIDVRFLTRTLVVIASQKEWSAHAQSPRWADPFPLIPWSLRSNLQPLWTIGEFRATALL